MSERIFGFTMIWGGGVVLALNLSRLLPCNSGYEASWWKVGVCVALSITGVVMACRKGD